MSAASTTGAVFQMQDYQNADPATQKVLQALLPNLVKLNDAVNRALGGGLSVAGNTNSAIITLDVTTANRTWSPTTYLNGWSAFSAPFNPTIWKLPGGLVEMQGSIKGGTLNNPAFAIPATYLPSTDANIAGGYNDAPAKMVVTQAAGQLYISSLGSTGFFSVNGTWMAADPTPLPAIAACQFASGIKGPAKGVTVLGACQKGRPELPVSVQSVVWADTGLGQISLSDLAAPGLKDSTTYTLTLLVLGG